MRISSDKSGTSGYYHTEILTCNFIDFTLKCTCMLYLYLNVPNVNEGNTVFKVQEFSWGMFMRGEGRGFQGVVVFIQVHCKM